jgi:hypothetical protein
MGSICNEILITETADELGLSEDLVRDVITFQGKECERVIKRGAFETVRLPYIGKLEANHKKVQKLNSIIVKK